MGRKSHRSSSLKSSESKRSSSPKEESTVMDSGGATSFTSISNAHSGRGNPQASIPEHGDYASYNYGGYQEPMRAHSASFASSTGSQEENEADADDSMMEKSAIQLLVYRYLYALQGVSMGLLGPSLPYFVEIANENPYNHISGEHVANFGALFAAHGASVLLIGSISELPLNVMGKSEGRMKCLLASILVFSGVWYGMVPFAAVKFGSLGIGCAYVIKGAWTALLNITLQRCCLWLTQNQIARGRSLITSLNLAFGMGCVIGPCISLTLGALSLPLSFAYYALSFACVPPILLLLFLPTPTSQYNMTQSNNETQSLLHNADNTSSSAYVEDPARRVPTAPSPIIGAVFLHVKHYTDSANINPDVYDPTTNLLVLYVTLFVTMLYGLQLSCAAFLFDYVGSLVQSATVEAQGPVQDDTMTSINETGSLWMLLFWASSWLSYCFFSTYMFHKLNLYSIVWLSFFATVGCGVLVFGNTALGVLGITFCLLVFGATIAPLFTLAIHCLTRVIDQHLIRRVASLVVFGCGMGEGFVPVLMGFFIGTSNSSNMTEAKATRDKYSAVGTTLFLLTFGLFSVSLVVLRMVKKKLLKLQEEEDGVGRNVGVRF